MARFEEHKCEKCGGWTNWIIRDLGTRCTGCGATVTGRGPFKWEEHNCSNCRGWTAWVRTGNGVVFCLRCGRGG